MGHAGCQPMYICAVSFITTRSINRGMPWRKESTVLVVALFLFPIITAEVNDYLLITSYIKSISFTSNNFATVTLGLPTIDLYIYYEWSQ